VRNGAITDFSSCVRLFNSFGAVVEKLRADCADVGISVGASSTVSGSQVTSNGPHAILAGSSGIVSGNVAISFDNLAIEAADNSIISDNVAGGDFGGIRAGSSSTVSGNNVRSTDEGGIFAGPGSTVSGNTVRFPEEEGVSNNIAVACPSNVIGNTAPELVLIGEGCTNIDNLVTSP
jgi:hypothetical protein